MKKILLFFLISIYLIACSSRNENRIYTTFDAASLKNDFETFRQVIKYAHPGKYFHCTPKELEKVFDSVENTINKNLTEIEFYNKLSVIVKKLGCIHTSINLSKVLADSLMHQEVLFPIPLMCIDNKIYVNSKESELPFGAEIISINDQNIDKILKKIESVNFADGFSKDYGKAQIPSSFHFDYYVTNGQQKDFKISLKAHPDSAKRNQIIKAENLEKVIKNYSDKWYEYNTATDFDLEILDEQNAAVLTIRSFNYAGTQKQDPFNHFLENTFKLLSLSKTKNLIIDLRDNSGGNYSNTMITYSYLGNRSINMCKKAWMIFDEVPYLTQIDNDDLKEANIVDEIRKEQFGNRHKKIYFLDSSQNEIYYKQTQNHFNGKIFVITNANTASSAAYFASLLKDENRAIIVGSETGGGATQHSGFKDITYILPNTKMKVSFSVAAVIHNLANKKQNVHRGVIPDYYKNTSFQDFIEGNDTEQNFILDSLINKKNKFFCN